MKETPKSTRGHREPVLLPVARKLFFTRGYEGTTMEKVAVQAGFSKRTVYLYYKNKDELFLSVGEEGLLILRKRLEAIDVAGLPVEDGIQAIMETYIWFAREHENYYRIIFRDATAEMIRNVSIDVRRRLEEHERACIGVVARVAQKALEQGIIANVDPWEAAAVFLGAATGIMLLSLGGSQTMFSRQSREELTSKAIWVLYQGLQKGR